MGHSEDCSCSPQHTTFWDVAGSHAHLSTAWTAGALGTLGPGWGQGGTRQIYSLFLKVWWDWGWQNPPTMALFASSDTIPKQKDSWRWRESTPDPDVMEPAPYLELAVRDNIPRAAPQQGRTSTPGTPACFLRHESSQASAIHLKDSRLEPHLTSTRFPRKSTRCCAENVVFPLETFPPLHQWLPTRDLSWGVAQLVAAVCGTVPSGGCISFCSVYKNTKTWPCQGDMRLKY